MKKRTTQRRGGKKSKAVVSKRGRVEEDMWFNDEKWTRLMVEDFACRRIQSGRHVSIDQLDESKNLRVISLFEGLNLVPLINFCPEERHVYEGEIRQFYCYLEEVSNAEVPLQVRSYVNEQPLLLTGGMLEEAFRIGGRGDVSDVEYEVSNARAILFPNRREEVFPKSSDLDVNMHIIHYIMTYNIVPVGGHRDSITSEQLRLLYHIHTGSYPDIGNVILRYMLSSKAKKSKSLPYGIILARLFRFCGVPLHESDPSPICQASIGLNTLRLMGIRRDRSDGDKWKYIDEIGRCVECGEPSHLLNNDQDAEDFDVVDGVYNLSVQFENLSNDLNRMKFEVGGGHRQLASRMESYRSSAYEDAIAISDEIKQYRNDVQEYRNEVCAYKTDMIELKTQVQESNELLKSVRDLLRNRGV